MATLFQRYCAGEHEQVWTELMEYQAKVRQEPLFLEAMQVARETMTRAKKNIELLKNRLVRIGYQFAYPDEVIVPPEPDVAAKIARLERCAGPLPLSLRAWYEIVGSVNFIGAHPEWEARHSNDPLVVDPLAFALEEYREWWESCAEFGAEEMAPYAVPVAPDEMHKATISGTPPSSVVIYNIPLPSPTADAVLREEPHRTTFVNYLRTCFRWGGFPGFEHAERRPERHLSHLTKGLHAL